RPGPPPRTPAAAPQTAARRLPAACEEGGDGFARRAALRALQGSRRPLGAWFGAAPARRLGPRDRITPPRRVGALFRVPGRTGGPGAGTARRPGSPAGRAIAVS